MKKQMVIRIVIFLLGASLLAGCEQAILPKTSPGAETLITPTVIAPKDNAPTTTPLPTSTPKSVPPSSTPITKDACILLTKDDVSKVIGQPIDAVTGKGLGGVCEYTTQNLSIDLTVSHTGGIKYLKDTRAKLGDSGLDVPGLGDEALYNTNSSTLILRKGDAAYLINYSDSSQELTQEDKLAKEKALAELLLSHLQ